MRLDAAQAYHAVESRVENVARGDKVGRRSPQTSRVPLTKDGWPVEEELPLNKVAAGRATAERGGAAVTARPRRRFSPPRAAAAADAPAEPAAPELFFWNRTIAESQIQD